MLGCIPFSVLFPYNQTYSTHMCASHSLCPLSEGEGACQQCPLGEFSSGQRAADLWSTQLVRSNGEVLTELNAREIHHIGYDPTNTSFIFVADRYNDKIIRVHVETGIWTDFVGADEQGMISMYRSSCSNESISITIHPISPL